MKFLIILGSGGHTAQMLKLVNLLGRKHNYEYVIEKADRVSQKKIIFKGRVFRFKATRKIKEFLPVSILKQIVGCIPAIRLIKKVNADIIVTCGPNFSIPIMVIGKLFGKKIVFIETWSRIYKKSLTGTIAYRIANIFFVQWPEMKKLYPKSIYAGRLG